MRLCRIGWELMGVAQAVVQMCSVKKMFLEISQNPQENICATCAKFLRTAFLKEHLWWLLVELIEVYGSGSEQGLVQSVYDLLFQFLRID